MEIPLLISCLVLVLVNIANMIRIIRLQNQNEELDQEVRFFKQELELRDLADEVDESERARN